MREIANTFFIFLYISIINCLNSHQQTKQNLSNAKQSKIQFLNAREFWDNISSLSSFGEIIRNYPFLTTNMEATKLAELINRDQCKYSFQPVRYAIINNTVYSYGLMKNSQQAILFETLLRRITTDIKFSDMYFVVHVNGKATLPDRQQTIPYICRSIPSFVYQKNHSSEIEKKKFLLPDPNLIKQWAKNIPNLKNMSEKLRWRDKIDKIFYQSNTLYKQNFLEKQCEKLGFKNYFYKDPDRSVKITEQNFINNKLNQYQRFKKTILYKGGQLQKLKYKFILEENNSRKDEAFSFFSNSLLLKTFPIMSQWFYSYINPNIHFLLVNNDCSNLNQTIKQLILNETKAQQMLKQANIFSQTYLSQKGILNFIIQTLKKYSQIQNLKLPESDINSVKNGVDINLILLEHYKKQQSKRSLASLESQETKLKFIKFQDTIDSFPFLKDNMKIQRIFTLLKEGGCGPHKRFVNYVFMNNHIYVSGQFKYHATVRNLTKLFQIIADKNFLLDMYFLVYIQNQLHSQHIPLQLYETCRQIPLFTLNKNISSYIEETKFLLPDLYVIGKLLANIQKFKQMSGKMSQKQKINRNFFESNEYDIIKSINFSSDRHGYFHQGDFDFLFTKNDTDIKQIIKRANVFADNYLTPESIYSYTHQILLKYSKIQQLKLTQFQKQLVVKGFQMEEIMAREKNILDAKIIGGSLIFVTVFISICFCLSSKRQQILIQCGLFYLYNICKRNKQQNKKLCRKIAKIIAISFIFFLILFVLVSYFNPEAQNNLNKDFLQMMRGDNIKITQNISKKVHRNFSIPYEKIIIQDQINNNKTLNYSNRVLKNSSNSFSSQKITLINENFGIWYYLFPQIKMNDSQKATQKVVNLEKNYPWVDYKQYEMFSKKYNLDQSVPHKNFCVISPFRNILSGSGRLNDLQLYMKSLQVQNYSNFQVVMVDDNSDDYSSQTIIQILNEKFPRLQQRLIIVQNLNSIGALGNRDIAIRKYCYEDSIILQLDADDFLIGKQVFNVMNRIYQKNEDLWFVYTNHLGIVYGSGRNSIFSKNIGGNKAINPQVLQAGSYRYKPAVDSWVTSHLKTYLRKMYIKIPLSYLMQQQKYYKQSTDRFMMYSIVELSGRKHTAYLDEILYLYNYPSHSNPNCQDQLRSYLNYKSSMLFPLKPLENLSKNATINFQYKIPSRINQTMNQQYQKYTQCLSKKQKAGKNNNRR